MAHRLFSLTPDTATVGLMGIHIIEGARPLFYYGQAYMGALEAYVVALAFWLFGVSTLSLAVAPILFAAAWVVATAVLFRRLAGVAAGVAAAWTVALAGWYPLWFSLATYGGYPEAFAMGTAFAAACLGLHDEAPNAGANRRRYMLIGLLGGLCVWTNLLSASYLAAGAVVFAAYVVRHRFHRAAVAGALVSGALTLAGFVPFLLARTGGSGNPLLGEASRAIVLTNLRVWADRCAAAMVAWPAGGWLAPTLLLACLAGLAVAGWVRVCATPRAWRLAWPALFLGLFSILYLLHPLASLGAVRYLIPFQTMFIAAAAAYAVSLHTGKMRRVAWVAVAGWLAYNAAGAVAMTVRQTALNAERRATRSALARHAKELGLRHVYVAGSRTEGLAGQIYTFYAGGDVNFVSCFDERHVPALRAADRDSAPGFLHETRGADAYWNALAWAGATACSSGPIGPWTLFRDVVWRAPAGTSIPPTRWTVRSEGGPDAEALRDRRDGTTFGAPAGRSLGVTVRLARPEIISELWFTAPTAVAGRLPRRLRVRVADAQGGMRDVAGEIHLSVHAYRAGPRGYAGGYHPRIELVFAPVLANELLIELEDPDRDWGASELVLFGTDPAPAAGATGLRAWLEAGGCQFLAADRWLSAVLGCPLPEKAPRTPAVFPTYNGRDRESRLPRLIECRAGLGVAVSPTVAAEAQAVLGKLAIETGLKLLHAELDGYALFLFQRGDAEQGARVVRMAWNGHLPLRE